MEFCPSCGRKLALVRKDIKPVISEDDMKSLPTTEVPCPRCSHDKAAYTEFQTRSADEPATITYFCKNDKCKHIWRED